MLCAFLCVCVQAARRLQEESRQGPAAVGSMAALVQQVRSD